MRRPTFLLLALIILFTWSTAYVYADGPAAELQAIPTDGAMDWEYFSIGSEHYLAAANFRFTDVDSKIYRWDGTSFVEFQSIPTNGAHDWEYFTIGNDHYLIVANTRAGMNDIINSKLYKWNGSSFGEYQLILTNGGADWKHFMIGADHYLVVANYRIDTNYNLNSRIYKWDGANFNEFQTIPTNGGHDWEHFEIEGEHYLVVANTHNGSFDFHVNSKIYKWNGTNFVEFQLIPTTGAWTWEYFRIGDDHYLGVANFQDNVSYNTNSKIYKWDGDDFVAFQSVPTSGGNGWEYFSVGDDHYLAMANHIDSSGRTINSKLYKWNGTNFDEFQSILTEGATDWEYFEIGAQPYLAVASYYEPASPPTASKIYKLLLPGYSSSPIVGNTIDLGSAKVGSTISATLAITETGNYTLTVGLPGSGLLTGANAADFNIANGPPFEIADDGVAHLITLECTPSAVGLRTATLNLTSNDPTQPNVSYALRCRGLPTEAKVALPIIMAIQKL